MFTSARPGSNVVAINFVKEKEELAKRIKQREESEKRVEEINRTHKESVQKIDKNIQDLQE